MKIVRISIDEETLQHVDRAASPLDLSRSEVVRQALRWWLRHQTVRNFEEEWISALRRRPDDPTGADDWLLSGDAHREPHGGARAPRWGPA
ncbi:MAG TPA: ribbon-helix-helix protein, CopG family [Vicinamibacterales bacterium]